MTWEDVLKRDDIVGGDIQTQEDGIVYRGPLSGIKIEGNLVYFEAPWCARMQGSKWEMCSVDECFVNPKDCPPVDIGSGCIQFDMPYLGFGVIITKGGSKLDPKMVEGLELAETTT